MCSCILSVEFNEKEAMWKTDRVLENQETWILTVFLSPVNLLTWVATSLLCSLPLLCERWAGPRESRKYLNFHHQTACSNHICVLNTSTSVFQCVSDKNITDLGFTNPGWYPNTIFSLRQVLNLTHTHGMFAICCADFPSFSLCRLWNTLWA